MKIQKRAISLMLLALLVGCAHQPVVEAPEVTEIPAAELNIAPPPAEQPADLMQDMSREAAIIAAARPPKSTLYQGSGRFINNKAARQPAVNRLRNGDVTLNFENASIREVADVILRDLLNENYAVDPAVTGNVSLQTSRGVARDSLLYVLENLLQLNGAALVQEGSLYRIVPLGSPALKNLQPSLPSLQNQNTAGFRVQIVPLQYIAAREMESILKPVVREGGILRVDEKRNLLMLAGTSMELQSWLQTVDIFDVNWLKGQSVGMFTLNSADANVVSKELRNILGTKEKATGAEMVRVEPLSRLNAVMVISPQASYVKEAKQWIERLDTVGSEPGVRLFVYQVKHRKAEELAALVQSIFVSGSGTSSVGRPASDLSPEPLSLAPDLKPVTLQSEKAVADKSEPVTLVSDYATADLSVPSTSGVSIVADEANNSILVLASASDYRSIAAALKKLDKRPLQVLIEASIVEVSLTDDLQYGLEWFFKNNGVIDNDKTGIGTLDLNNGGGLSQVVPGFSYSVIDGADVVRGVLNALAQESKLNVLSSPSLMVLDNRTATIRVGDQQPVRTASTVSPEASTVTERIEYKDTGVLLTVTPQVHAGGLVTMDISQEVTDVGSVDSATGQRSFLQRNIGSTVAIQDGKTIVLGGLITENTTVSESGIPVLYKIPVLGKLFGQTTKAKLRRELVVLITPKVVQDTNKAVQITNEFKERLRNMYPQNDAENTQVISQ